MVIKLLRLLLLIMGVFLAFVGMTLVWSICVLIAMGILGWVLYLLLFSFGEYSVELAAWLEWFPKDAAVAKMWKVSILIGAVSSFLSLLGYAFYEYTEIEDSEELAKRKRDEVIQERRW